MRKTAALFLVLFMGVALISGCGSGVSEDKPMSEVKQEAQTMNADQLKDMIAKYQKAIEAKKPELQKLQAKLKEIPVTQLMGKEASEIKDEITALTDSVKALTERMKAYQAALSQK